MSERTIESPEPIAIVGMGCRLPGGVGSAAALWKLLCDGVDAIVDIPADRWDPDQYFSPEPQAPGRMICRRAGCLDDVASFDAEFFGIAPRVAEHMDPQQRVLLKVSWDALEDAGIPPSTLVGGRTGVFVGLCGHDYGDLHSGPSELEGLNAHTATGQFISIVANRISYMFDLRGPSLVIDTACSFSLVAVHVAVNALRSGECSLALAGGCNIMLSPYGPISLSQAMMLSPDGQSKAFDTSANGFVRGEGAGVVVLKRVTDAIRDRDRIYALVRNTAVNQDGRTSGITVPNGEAQVANALAALGGAGIEPSRVGYIEAHGTGTPTGDPIEGNALGRVVNSQGGSRPDRRVLMGSVKTNIGHLEGGAGIAGLMKAALVVRHKRIPPRLHFRNGNPTIDFEQWKLAVPTKVEDWPAGYQDATALVNSFGFGGTNAVAVLQELPAITDATTSDRPSTDMPNLLRLSARSEDALRLLTERWEARLDEPDTAGNGLASISSFLALRRDHHSHRLGIVAKTPKEAASQLRQWRDQGHADGVAYSEVSSRAPRKLAFVFNGQGPQWWGMGRQLLEHEPVVRDVVGECDRVARKFVDWSIREELLASEEQSRVNAVAFLQPTMFALQLGLVELWKSWGVEPEGVVGHSLGDITAACVAGIIDIETALQIICHRARLQATANPEGGMLYVALAQQDVQSILDTHPESLWLSAVNGPAAVTLSGDRDLLRRLQQELNADSVFARLLRVNCACHSPHMEPLKDELMTCIRDVRHQDGHLRFYSTVLGRRTMGSEIDQEYWWTNFRRGVVFYDAIKATLDDGFNTFVEISPHPVLRQAMKDILAQDGLDGLALHSLVRELDDLTSLRQTQAQLYAAGLDIDWHKAHPGPCPHVDAPTHPWCR